MLRNIGNVACFIIVLMTSHHVTGQADDVAQLNRRLTIIKHSVDDDIVDIRLDIMELKMIVEQIVGGQRITSDEPVIGQGMTNLHQREITDLKNKLNAHKSRLNRLFSTVNEIQVENTALKNKVNQFFEEKENGVKTELLKLNAGIETKFDDIVNVLQMKFEETTAAMMKGYKDLKTHVNVKVSMVHQINNLVQSIISEQNKLSTRLDQAEARIIRLDGEVIKLEVDELVEKNERNELINNLKAELLQLNAGVNALQLRFEESTTANLAGYKYLETHMSVQMKNLTQSVISEQNILSARMDRADKKIVRLDGGVNKLEVDELVEKNERNELINNLKAELLQLNAGVETKCDDRVNALQSRFEESTTANLEGYKYLETHMSVQIKNLTQSVISEQNKLSARMDHSDANIVRLDGGVNKLADFSIAVKELKAKTDKCFIIDCGDPTPDHGTVNTTETTIGTVVQISCNHGYVLSGANIAKCNADLVWSESATCKPYDCGSAAPANGVATATNGTSYKKQATVKCNPGYTLKGSSVIECNATGWNESVSCIQNCGDPTPDRGTVNTTETTFGTVVQISCNHGYVLRGANIAKCNEESVWSESATCNPYGKKVLGIIQSWYTF